MHKLHFDRTYLVVASSPELKSIGQQSMLLVNAVHDVIGQSVLELGGEDEAVDGGEMVGLQELVELLDF
jgi:hypothetical protein